MKKKLWIINYHVDEGPAAQRLLTKWKEHSESLTMNSTAYAASVTKERHQNVYPYVLCPEQGSLVSFFRENNLKQAQILMKQ